MSDWPAPPDGSDFDEFRRYMCQRFCADLWWRDQLAAIGLPADEASLRAELWELASRLVDGEDVERAIAAPPTPTGATG